jgi:hypothetical protein
MAQLPSSFSFLQHHHKRSRWLSSFSFQTQRKQNTQENNKKKTKRREGVFLQALVLPSHFWLLLLPFCFKHFLLASSSSQIEEKKRKTKKKNHKEEKKMQRREGTFL